jgi:hypothetical protein
MSGTNSHRFAASLRRLGGKQNRSESYLPDINSGPEQLEGEHAVRFATFGVHLYSLSAFQRSQTQSPQPKSGIKDKFKELFTSKSKGASRTISPALQAENSRFTEVRTDWVFGVSPITNPREPTTDQPSNSVPSITVIAPQDQVPSHKETLSDQISAPDHATVDAAREDADRAASAMRVIGTPVQSATSAVNNADNPIPLVDFISNFLKTLSSFNSVVDKIATVRSSVPTRPVRSSHA